MRNHRFLDARVGAALAAPVVLLAACGGGGPNYGSSSSSSGSSGSSQPASGATQVATHSGSDGTYLTDSSGRTLYLFASDHGTTSTCNGPCAAAWPPLTAAGMPTGSGGAHAAMLGEITRSDGSKQVTYAHHPLYYYAGDSSAGDTNGQGSTAFGAAWWIVAPSGSAITSSGSSSGSSGGSYGGGRY